MINLLLFLVFVAIVSIGAAWVAENPGEVTMYWFDWRIDTSLAFLLLALIAAAFALAYAILLIRMVIRLPFSVKSRRSERVYRKGLAEITYSVAALAASDIATAQQHTQKAQKLLGQTPLTLLLQAQIARSNGDDEKTHALLTQMLDHKETEYLAARSLSDNASRQHLLSSALAMAQRAQKVNPRDGASAQAVISLHMRMHQWQEALAAIDMAARKGRWHRNKANRARGLVHLCHGMHLLATDEQDVALHHARLALKTLGGFVPAVLFAARCHYAAGNFNKAAKLILQCWKHSPHPALAAQLRLMTSREPKQTQLRWARKLAAQNPDHPQSKLALAETAIKLQEWELARESLRQLIEYEETMQACKLMAYVEQGEFSDFDAAGRWLARSSEAHADPAWHCNSCGMATEQWDAHCANCHAYNSMEWKTATLKFGSEDRL